MNLLQQLEAEHIAELGKTIPDFSPGDTIRVGFKVTEGTRTRIQNYEGVCISRKGGDRLAASFTVRKISYNEGVERIFPLYSPRIDSIELVRRGDVRRAKLYYLRGRRGKSARISEKTTGAAGKATAAERVAATAARAAAQAALAASGHPGGKKKKKKKQKAEAKAKAKG